MAQLAPARRVALKSVSKCRNNSGRMREVLRASDDMNGLEARDRSLVSRLALGVVATHGLLDQKLNELVRRPSSLEPRVRDALCVAAFEALYLDTPPNVVVSQGVELVRSVTPRAAGMANAVLRRMVSQGRVAVAQARERVSGGGADLDDLALVSALPAWVLRRVVADRGEAAARSLALSQLEPPPVYVAGNARLHDELQTVALLEEAGLDPVAAALPGSYELRNPALLEPSGLVQAADVVVSDLAAQCVARLCDPQPGQRVLEIGQGRGTKSLLLQNAALRHGGPAHIVGVDVVPYKARVAAERMERAGLGTWVSCETYDAARLGEPDVPDALKGPFDLVFVDAPCSGSGTMRRHPEIAWSLREDALAGEGSLCSLQSALLAAAASRVRAGGLLAYATCSVFAREDEWVVQGFLGSAAGAGFELERISADALPAGCVSELGHFVSIPAPGSFDGHFCALLRRRS